MSDLQSLLDKFDRENPAGEEITISPGNIDVALGTPSIFAPLLSDPALLSDIRKGLHNAFESASKVDTRKLAVKLEFIKMPSNIRAAIKKSLIEIGREQ